LLAVLHARVRVEHQGRGQRRFLIAQHARGHDAWTRQRRGQQKYHGAAQCQQQPMAKSHLPAVGSFAHFQKPHRRELQIPWLLPHDQVQQDRHRDRQRSAQECYVEKCHFASRSIRNRCIVRSSGFVRGKTIQYLARRLAR
jgi:hypothetical protein